MSFLNLTREQKLTLQGLAARMKGIPYKYGAEVLDLNIEPEQIKEIDCSETLEYLFHKDGFKVPDGAANQFEASKEIDESEADIGCPVFKRHGGKIIHVALVISVEGTEILVVEAAGSLKKVVIRTLEEFKVKPRGPEYAGMRRFIAEKVKAV